MRSRITALFICVGLMACFPASAEQFDAQNIQPTGLTAEQAKQVMAIVMKHLHNNLSDSETWIEGPYIDKETGKPVEPGYYHFGLIDYDSKGGAADTLGSFLVNAVTGDVWDIEICKRYRFPALSTIQERIMAKTGKRLATEGEAKEELGCD